MLVECFLIFNNLIFFPLEHLLSVYVLFKIQRTINTLSKIIAYTGL